MSTLDELALIRLPDVLRLVGYKRTTLYKLMRANKFPASVKLAGGYAVAWRAADVRGWLLSQGAEQ